MNFQQLLITVLILVFAAPMAWSADDDNIEDDAAQSKSAAKPAATTPAAATKPTAATATPAAAKPAAATSSKSKAKPKPTPYELQNKGNGKITTVSRVVAPFNGVYISGDFKVNLKVADTQQVKVTIDENLVSAVKTSADGGRLDISLTREIKPSSPIIVDITTPRLSGIWLNNANATITDLKADTVNCEMVGKAKLKVTGTAMLFRATLDDSAQLEAADLATMKADIKTSASSKAEIKASDRLKAVAFGDSKIFYSGHVATVNQKATGTSVIKSVDTATP